MEFDLPDDAVPDGKLSTITDHLITLVKDDYKATKGLAKVIIVPPPPTPDPTQYLTVYTDGSCTKYGAYGGWAFAYVDGTKTRHRSGGRLNTTNNQMELMAVIKALEYLPGPLDIISDSKYVITGASEWHVGWVKNGWVTAGGAPVKNRELWEKLLALKEDRKVKFKWVKGHNGNKMNELCDELASKAGKLVQKLGCDHVDGLPS